MNSRHVAAGTALTYSNDQANTYPVPLTTSGVASVHLDSTSITLAPGKSAKFRATFSAPTGLNASQYPVYSGWITIISPIESLQVPYVGVAATLKNKQVLDGSDYYFGEPLPAILDGAGNFQNGTSNYTFKDNDSPALVYRLMMGTPHLRADLVPASFNFTPTIAKRASYSAVPTLGNLVSVDYFPRSSIGADNSTGGYNWVGLNSTFANGTDIPKGQYKILVRALHVTGNPSKEDDYDSWVSPIFGIV
jgi:hypothetical protein